MKKKEIKNFGRSAALITVGSAMFALAFNLFLQPNNINSGGVSGIGQILSHITGFGSVALWSVILNVPLFLLGLHRIGRNFFIGSLAGLLISSAFLELSAGMAAVEVEPLLGAIFGGVFVGAGLGLVFLAGASTGGSDIAARLLRPALPEIPIGRIMMVIDLIIVTLTGLVFGDVSNALYSAVSLYACSAVIDALIYGFDNSGMAIIISDHYEAIAAAIDGKLERGVTLLDGQGYYTRRDKKVLLSAVKKRQIAELKRLVTDIDPKAFVILADAHQVLGDGFKRYDKMGL